ncbi:NAD-P-binding protein [Trametes coccinea BRFM310]|uniref:NAD-P-binding protein n=1 Tax=Trametes coccinea (strain BRFM310) TaxID=1353009 RepID=A0A1Y2I630_TRAC3|nr:NAD-P-binding protein [Trametes coccinea BRFM310]
MSEKTIDSAPRVALVTGAAQGIGKAIALRLAEDGLDVAVLDLPQKRDQLEAVVEAIKAKGRGTVALYVDVSSEPEIEAAIQGTVDRLGGLDVIVANAAICEVMPIVDLTVESFDKTVAVNARGVMLAIKHAARHMIAQGRGGRIIGTAGTYGYAGLLHVPAYTATKFAVRGLVQSAALELRGHDITVNGYCPGIIMTDMTSFPDDEANGGHGTTLRKHFEIPPDIKPATPDVVASFVSYIAKPESRYITGECMICISPCNYRMATYE